MCFICGLTYPDFPQTSEGHPGALVTRAQTLKEQQQNLADLFLYIFLLLLLLPYKGEWLKRLGNDFGYTSLLT